MNIFSLTSTFILESVSNGSSYSGALGTFRDSYTGVEGFWTEIENVLVICFKASNEEIDWFTNFNFWSRVYPYGDKSLTEIRFHRGYMKGYLSCKDIIRKAVGSSTCEEVFICGYSMGGGVAQICALDIQFNFPNKKVACSFSGPKVMNKAGQVSFDKRIPNAFRFKYQNDIVTKVVPFMKPVGNYIHLGNKVYWWKMSVKDHANGYSAISEYCKSKS